ncbi:Lipoprotein-releasing system transmembrane protein LolC [Pseudomonas sp. OF001]|uniref:lipoprotein-releasing ABC transporter permease subunit n=1 Tax=unclassified Pseudomonas TaxID=196821 RepID=UPI0010A621D4|nr:MULTISPECIES: lipoprotein-releasing ABC transporter permease subunit [unclassified Pseudomonas]THG84776.1 lipoprotein-releasing ABC transporter permease subunit [Pseudomonas sp. A-1]CAD5377474.1 Lipoprotein-releasing system transmembrane protein LolC [Pseudomonas sp. OF001]
MFRPLPVFIGMRYTRAKRRNHFISFISLTSMVGLALGVLVMILVLSVMNGFDRELRTRILGMVPHATISSYQPIDDWQALAARVAKHPEVVAVAPFSQLQGMLTHSGGTQPVLVNAVLPEAEKNVSIIDQHMVQGSLEALKSGEFGIVIGEITARRFRVNVGDKLTFILPEASVTPAGVFPRLKRFTVVGVFKVGAELDSSLALIHIGDAARLSRWQENQVEGVRLKLKDLFKAPQVAWEIATGFSEGDYVARDWTRSHGSLFQAIQMEKTMIALLLLLIVAVAAFNIISTLVMVVTDKKADIAILRTLGMTPRQIMLVFMVQGSVIGVVGTLIGGVLGVIAALNVTQWVAALENLLGRKFLSSDVYFINYLPSQLRVEDVVLICSAALLMSFFATLYPAWRAARTQPAEALRYE